MKVDRISLKGFLSHDHTDWSPNGASLVALVGPNGAGKSSLLDAVQYALFDSARGRTDDLVRLGSDEMSATIEFTFDGAHYRVTRGRSRKGGGKSYLELAVRDGEAWTPLTGDTIKDTQRRIEELLRIDAATFGTAVLLGQGQAARFVEATAAERKRILGVILGLARYEAAEAKAREKARELDAAVDAARERIDRLEERIGGQNWAEALVERTADLEATNALITAAEGEKLAAEATLRGLVVRATEAERAQADVQRLEAQRETLRERYTRAKDTASSAIATIERAQAALTDTDAIATAVEALPGASERLAELEATRERADAAATRIIEARAELERLERDHAKVVSDHEARVRSLRDRHAQLKSSIDRLEPVTCPACRHEFAADPADLRGQYAAVAAELAAIAEVKPEEPLAVTRARAAHVRAESAAAGVPTVDDEDLRAARAALLATERLAARAGELEAQRTAKAEAERHRDAAAAEMAAIDTEGQAVTAQLAEARAAAEQAAGIVAEKARAEASLEATTVRLAELADERRGIEQAKAQAEAQLEQVRAWEAERDELASTVDAGALEVERHRKLAAAFGRNRIPARIIEGTLPELTGHVNEVLEQLRPGMTLAIRAQRAKKSGDGVVEALDLVVRDAAGERPLALFSGGERMSVSLAIAVGLSRLVARRAGSRISTLIVDEPDGLDVDSRRALGQALKVLAHRGELERIVVVTHTADLAEYGDAVYEVSRNGAGSHVELVA